MADEQSILEEKIGILKSRSEDLQKTHMSNDGWWGEKYGLSRKDPFAQQLIADIDNNDITPEDFKNKLEKFIGEAGSRVNNKIEYLKSKSEILKDLQIDAKIFDEHISNNSQEQQEFENIVNSKIIPINQKFKEEYLKTKYEDLIKLHMFQKRGAFSNPKPTEGNQYGKMIQEELIRPGAMFRTFKTAVDSLIETVGNKIEEKSKILDEKKQVFENLGINLSAFFDEYISKNDVHQSDDQFKKIIDEKISEEGKKLIAKKEEYLKKQQDELSGKGIDYKIKLQYKIENHERSLEEFKGDVDRCVLSLKKVAFLINNQFDFKTEAGVKKGSFGSGENGIKFFESRDGGITVQCLDLEYMAEHSIFGGMVGVLARKVSNILALIGDPKCDLSQFEKFIQQSNIIEDRRDAKVLYFNSVLIYFNDKDSSIGEYVTKSTKEITDAVQDPFVSLGEFYQKLTENEFTSTCLKINELKSKFKKNIESIEKEEPNSKFANSAKECLKNLDSNIDDVINSLKTL